MVIRPCPVSSSTPGDKVPHSARRPLKAPISFDSFDKSIRQAAAAGRLVDSDKAVRKVAAGHTVDSPNSIRTHTTRPHLASSHRSDSATRQHQQIRHTHHVGSASSSAPLTRSHERRCGRHFVPNDGASISYSGAEEEEPRPAPPSEYITPRGYDGLPANGHFVVHPCSAHHRRGYSAGGYRIRMDEYTGEEASYALSWFGNKRADDSTRQRHHRKKTDPPTTVHRDSQAHDNFSDDNRKHRRRPHRESSSTTSSTHRQHEHEREHEHEHEHEQRPEHEHEQRHDRKHHRREASNRRAGHGNSSQRRRNRPNSEESRTRKHRHRSALAQDVERRHHRVPQREGSEDIIEPVRACSSTAPSRQRRHSHQRHHRLENLEGEEVETPNEQARTTPPHGHAEQRHHRLEDLEGEETHKDHHKHAQTTRRPASMEQPMQWGAPELAAAVQQFLDAHRRDIADISVPPMHNESMSADMIDQSTIIVSPPPCAHDHPAITAPHLDASPPRLGDSHDALCAPHHGADKSPSGRDVHADVRTGDDNGDVLQSLASWHTQNVEAWPSQDVQTGAHALSPAAPCGVQQCCSMKVAEVQALLAEKATLLEQTETTEQSHAVAETQLHETASELGKLRGKFVVLQEKHREFTLEQRRVAQTLRAREEQAQESLRVATEELTKRQETLDQLRHEYHALLESRCPPLDAIENVHTESDIADMAATDADARHTNKGVDQTQETLTLREKRVRTLEKTLRHLEGEHKSEASRRMEICKEREAELAASAKKLEEREAALAKSTQNIEERLKIVEEKEETLIEREKAIEDRAVCESAEEAAQREHDSNQRQEVELRQQQEAFYQRDIQMMEEFEDAKEQMRMDFAQQKNQYCADADRTIQDMHATLAALTAKVAEYESHPKMLSRSGDLLLQDLKRREEAVCQILTSIARVLHIVPHRDILVLAREIFHWITAGLETSASSPTRSNSVAHKSKVASNLADELGAHKSIPPSNLARELVTPAFANPGARSPTAWQQQPPAAQHVADTPHTFINLCPRDASSPNEELHPSVQFFVANAPSPSGIPPPHRSTADAVSQRVALSYLETEEVPRPSLLYNGAILSIAHATQGDGGPLCPRVDVPALSPTEQQQVPTLRNYASANMVRPSQIRPPMLRHAEKKTPRNGNMSARGTPCGNASGEESRRGGTDGAMRAMSACGGGASSSSAVATPGSGRLLQAEERKGVGSCAPFGRARGEKARSTAGVTGVGPMGLESESTASTTSTVEGRLDKDVSAQISSVRRQFASIRHTLGVG
eukprot:GEMP01002533.1.p1 GENE.GEMP01002533.1~~GEMP01002533.1.p1  ORF type:complete len:1291 (+),score=392.13 GEMP01002533.1:141-4013(+)